MLKTIQKWIDSYFAEEETIILVLLLSAFLLLMFFFGSELAPVIISIIIAYLLQGLVAFFSRWCCHRWAVTITFVIFMGVAATILLLAVPIIGRQLQALAFELPKILNKLHLFVKQLNLQYPDAYATFEVEQLMSHGIQKAAGLGQTALSTSIETIPNVLALTIYIVLIPILVFFFLKDKTKILAWLGQFLPSKRPFMQSVWQEMNVQVANYARGKAVEVFIVAGVTIFSFAVMNQNYAVLLGVLVGLSVVVPYIGAVIVTIPVALVAFFQWGWSENFFYVFGVYLFIQFLDGNVLVPLLFSEAVDLHPVAIIIAVLIFGGAWGFWGVFFAIPLATLIKALIEAWPTKEQIQQ
ncbi:MAG: AI-2E family transporter [Cellvibrionales bacterium]|nr:AI-2E family transporter [Cellvibrionales bacterium]